MGDGRPRNVIEGVDVRYSDFSCRLYAAYISRFPALLELYLEKNHRFYDHYLLYLKEIF